MSEQDSDTEFSLVPYGSRELIVTETAQDCILAEMVESSLVLARASAVSAIDLDALVREGKRLQRKEGMTPEDVQAFQLFHRAAVAGHAEGQFLASRCYRLGNGVQQDEATALEWLKKAADAGWGAGYFCLGIYCIYGRAGIAKNEDQGIKWLEKADERGFRNASMSLNNIYKERKNFSEALKWERRHAELGYGDSLWTVIHDYEDGNMEKGVVADYNEAARWRRLGAELHGWDNPHGWTTTIRPEALKGYLRAAEQGGPGAQYWLGTGYRGDWLGGCYRGGVGVPTDMIQAHAWFQLASDQGERNAKEEATAVAALMEPAEFKAAQQLYEEFKAKYSARR